MNVGGGFLIDFFNLIDPHTPLKWRAGDVDVRGASVPQHIFKIHYLIIVKFIFFAIVRIILQVNNC